MKPLSALADCNEYVMTGDHDLSHECRRRILVWCAQPIPSDGDPPVCFETVMVHVDIDGKSNGRIQVALRVADWFSSNLIGISAALLPPYPAETGYFVTLEAIERERRDVEAALACAEASFRNIADADQKGLEWRSDIELPEFYVVSEARAADLLVLGRQGADVARSLDAGGVVRYLARHNVQAGPTIAAHPKGGVADELIRLATAERADLIVAGAYGHSRLGEWAFGGVTRDLLTSSPVCCLLSH